MNSDKFTTRQVWGTKRPPESAKTKRKRAQLKRNKAKATTAQEQRERQLQDVLVATICALAATSRTLWSFETLWQRVAKRIPLRGVRRAEIEECVSLLRKDYILSWDEKERLYRVDGNQLAMLLDKNEHESIRKQLQSEEVQRQARADQMRVSNANAQSVMAAAGLSSLLGMR